MNTGSVAHRTRLKERYYTSIRPALKEALQLPNVMQVPHIEKVVVNVGAGDALSDSKYLQHVCNVLQAITGQAPIKTRARKSIAGFKIREGMYVGSCVTLRGTNMYVFLDKLINLALPRVRDFQGVPVRFDGRGGYNLGLKECNIFPEAEAAGANDRSFGMNITIQTTASTNEHTQALLKEFGMPFRKSKK